MNAGLSSLPSKPQHPANGQRGASRGPGQAQGSDGGRSKKRKADESRDRDRDRDERERQRERDRTGPRNLKDERTAAERDCPWAQNVPWDDCQDAARM